MDSNNLKQTPPETVMLLEKFDRLIWLPGKFIRFFASKLRKPHEPYFYIERDLGEVRETLRLEDYETDIKDSFHPIETLNSMTDGVIPQYNQGETIAAVKSIAPGERVHLRFFETRHQGEKAYRVESHTEPYPDNVVFKHESLLSYLLRIKEHLTAEKANTQQGYDIAYKIFEDSKMVLGSSLEEAVE